jgi:FKBP-type peptidyl-prolyl cis-trans isomerase 2
MADGKMQKFLSNTSLKIEVLKYLVLLFLVLAACSTADRVKIGDTVAVHYVGTFDSGEVFDESEEPLKFKVGAGEMIEGFEKAVIGMEVGEEKEVRIPPKEAYGERDEQKVIVQSRDNVETEGQLKPGMTLMAFAPDGTQRPVKVVDVSENEVAIDMNHPLAGKVLNFKIELVEIS